MKKRRRKIKIIWEGFDLVMEGFFGNLELLFSESPDHHRLRWNPSDIPLLKKQVSGFKKTGEMPSPPHHDLQSLLDELPDENWEEELDRKLLWNHGLNISTNFRTHPVSFLINLFTAFAECKQRALEQLQHSEFNLALARVCKRNCSSTEECLQYLAEERLSLSNEYLERLGFTPPWQVLNEMLEHYQYRCRVEFLETENERQVLWQSKLENSLRFDQLSSGEQSAIHLFSWLLLQGYPDSPNLLLFDEPDKHFDPQTCELFCRVINEQFVNKGVQVILATHRLETLAAGANVEPSPYFCLQRSTVSPGITRLFNYRQAFQSLDDNFPFAFIRKTINCMVEDNDDQRFYHLVYLKLVSANQITDSPFRFQFWSVGITLFANELLAEAEQIPQSSEVIKFIKSKHSFGNGNTRVIDRSRKELLNYEFFGDGQCHQSNRKTQQLSETVIGLMDRDGVQKQDQRGFNYYTPKPFATFEHLLCHPIIIGWHLHMKGKIHLDEKSSVADLVQLCTAFLLSGINSPETQEWLTRQSDQLRSLSVKFTAENFEATEQDVLINGQAIQIPLELLNSRGHTLLELLRCIEITKAKLFRALEDLPVSLLSQKLLQLFNNIASDVLEKKWPKEQHSSTQFKFQTQAADNYSEDMSQEDPTSLGERAGQTFWTSLTPTQQRLAGYFFVLVPWVVLFVSHRR